MFLRSKPVRLPVLTCGPLLCARSVSFSFSRRTPVLRGVSFVLERGKLVALIGANGSGKSTLLRTLAGLLVPTCGEILLSGQPLSAVSKNLLAQRIAYVPQSYSTPFPFTAFEMVLAGRSPYRSRLAFESSLDCEKAYEALEMSGASHLAQRPIPELSGGEKQLVGFARALAQEPQCLLLDEPAASLDLKRRARLIHTLVQLRDQRGLSVLIVTHDLPLITPVFDVVLAMQSGRVVAEGTPVQVLTRQALAEIYDDPDLKIERTANRTFVWSEGTFAQP